MKIKKKTHKATAKRFKLTRNDKVLHLHQGDNTHLKANKNRLQKARRRKGSSLANAAEAKKIKQFI